MIISKCTKSRIIVLIYSSFFICLLNGQNGIDHAFFIETCNGLAKQNEMLLKLHDISKDVIISGDPATDTTYFYDAKKHEETGEFVYLDDKTCCPYGMNREELLKLSIGTRLHRSLTKNILIIDTTGFFSYPYSYEKGGINYFVVKDTSKITYGKEWLNFYLIYSRIWDAYTFLLFFDLFEGDVDFIRRYVFSFSYYGHCDIEFKDLDFSHKRFDIDEYSCQEYSNLRREDKIEYDSTREKTISEKELELKLKRIKPPSIPQE